MPVVEIEISVSDVSVVSIPALTANQTLLSGCGWFAGWSLRETTGAAAASAHFESGGNLIGVVNLAAGTSGTQWLGDHGVYIPQEIVLVVDSGEIEGSAFIGFRRA